MKRQQKSVKFLQLTQKESVTTTPDPDHRKHQAH